MSAFEELGVCPELSAADDAGWLLPTAVQAEATPLILGGGDVLVAAETGSGKTGAFGVPVLQIVHESLRQRGGRARRDEALGNLAGRGFRGRGSTTTTAANVAMSASDRSDAFAVSPDGFRTQARDPRSWAGGRASVGVTSGKHYYEVEVTDDGLVRVGWSARASRARRAGDGRALVGVRRHGEEIARRRVRGVRRERRRALRQRRRRGMCAGLRRRAHLVFQERRSRRRRRRRP